MNLNIRPIKTSDAESICAIYNYYVRSSIVTFEEKVISVSEMANRIKAAKPNCPWLVCLEKNKILGFAKATPWKERIAYRFTVESTIYINPEYIGKGVGKTLYKALLKELGSQKVHSVIAGIALPNKASEALHKKLEFTRIGQFKNVGFKFNKWIDVGYWQLILKSDKNENTFK
jgi:L-amino acid N-acyltransferase YncA